MKHVSKLVLLFIFSLHTHAQVLNQEITTEEEPPFLLGKINKSALERDSYKSWFNPNYDNYQPDIKLINEIAPDLKNYSITLFMGTWCGDSQKEVPRLFKVLEKVAFPMEQLTVIAVSRQAHMYKQSPTHEEAGLNIHRVPTIIFYKGDKEVNRIVEHPIDTFEADIKNILTTNTYQSNYRIVSAIDEILNKNGVEGLRKKTKKILKSYEGKVSSMFELNTYGRILYGTDRIEEAIEVFKFNTKLFPNEARTYMSLANVLGVSGKKEQAIKVLEEAIKTHPDDKDLKENLEVIKSN